LWVDAGYQGKEWLAWIETALGWTVEIVRKPRRWVWCPADVEPPPMPAFTVLKRTRVTKRTIDRCSEGVVTCEPPRPGA
jgi:transposase